MDFNYSGMSLKVIEGELWIKAPLHQDGRGYWMTRIMGKAIRLHRLLCEGFHGPPKKGQVARHLNGDHLDNSEANLTWGTQAQNCLDTVVHGNSTKGEKNPRAVLTLEQVKEIRQRRASGEMGRALAEEFGVTDGTVCDIHKGRTWGTT